MKIINFNFLKKNDVYIHIFLLSFLYIFLKYILSSLLLPNIDLVLKIIYFSDTEYFDIVESLSRFDIFLIRSKFELAENIFGFPFFSMIFHSLIFNIFGFYSFLILEFSFHLLICLLLFKIFNILFDNRYLSLTILFSFYSLLLALEIAMSIENFSDISRKIHLPIVDFIGNRFPRPIVTSLMVFLIIYNNLIIISKIHININKNILIISLSLMFLMNSFFFLFINLFLSSFWVLHKKIFKDFSKLLIFTIPISIGLIILLLQQFHSEPDYENRIGMLYIDFNDKLLLLNHFIKKIFQLEIILLLLINTIFIYLIRNNNNEIIVKKFNFLYICFISSILAPFIFVIFLNKVISLYYFWTIIKFFGFFTFIIFFYELFKKFFTKKIFYFFLCVFVVIVITKNFRYVSKINNNQTFELNEVYKFLEDKYKGSDFTFYGETNRIKFNQRALNLIWLSLENRYLMYPPGFSTSLKDEQLENLILHFFKIMNVNDETFFDILNDQSCSRDCFARYFTHKYSVNSLRHKKDLQSEYNLNDQKLILKIAPIIWWHLRIDKTEKRRLIDKYKTMKKRPAISPDLIVLDKNHKFFSTVDILENYDLIFTTSNFFNIFLKK